MEYWMGKVIRLEHRIWFWAALGPLLVILTLLVVGVMLPFALFPVAVGALVGLPLCCLFRRRGAFFSFVVLALFGLAAIYLSPEKGVWYGATMGTLSASFFITHLSFKEMTSSIERLVAERRAVKNELADVREGFTTFKRKTEEEGRIERVMLSELQTLQSERNDLLEEIYGLRQKLGDSRTHDACSQLKQLREQFEEKQKVLDQTRIDLFAAESDALHRKLASEEEALADEDNSYVCELIDGAEATDELEGLVAHLLAELKNRSIPSQLGFPPKNQ